MKEIKAKLSKFNQYLPVLIVLIAFFLRIYHAKELFFWHVDEDIIALTARRIVVDHHIQLIGFPLPGGIYLGPLFYYIVSAFYFISGMNPFGLSVFAAFLGIIATFLVYKVGLITFMNKRLAIFASIIFGFSYLVNVYSRVFTGLTFGPIYTLLVYLFLFQIIKFGKIKNLIFLALVLMLAIQNEGSSISLIMLVIVTWIVFRFEIPRKYLIFFFLIFILFHLPLLIFDLKHNFFILHSFFGFFTRTSNSHLAFNPLLSLINVLTLFPSTLARLLLINGYNDIGFQILPCDGFTNARFVNINLLIFVFSLAIILFFIIRSALGKKITVGQKIVFLHLLILAVGLLLFNVFLNGYLYEWVLVIFFPGFAFLVGYFLDIIWLRNSISKILVLIFLVLFSYFSIKNVLTSSDKFGLKDKMQATKWALEKIGDKPFYLDSLGSCYQNGYVYLFLFNGRQPVSTYSDDVFTPTFYRKSTLRPTIGVVMVNPSNGEGLSFWNKYLDYSKKTIEKKQIGNIEVLVVDDNK